MEHTDIFKILLNTWQ